MPNWCPQWGCIIAEAVYTKFSSVSTKSSVKALFHPYLEAPFSPGASVVLRMKTTLQDELLGPRAAAGVHMSRRPRDWQSSYQALLADGPACHMPGAAIQG